MRSNRNARGRPLSYCKACEMEDFAHSDLVPVLREIYAGTDRRFPHDYPRGNEDRKHWETAMTVRALRDHGREMRGSQRRSPIREEADAANRTASLLD